MIQAYPYQLSDAGNGAVMMRFVDVPELIVQADSEELAKQWAARDLRVALNYYADEGRKIPRPSKPKKGQHLAYLSPLVTMKLEIYHRSRRPLSKPMGAQRIRYLTGAVRSEARPGLTAGSKAD